MNYLAHALLSFNKPEILVGNMISDFVKGKTKLGYPVMVQKGMELHRAIDAFTDTHEATAKAKDFFRPDYRLYSGPITDILYDYFLANDETLFFDASLLSFTNSVYQTLEKQTVHLPHRFLSTLLYMKTDNWLYHYKTKEGIQKSLRGMIHRANFISDSDKAIDLFHQHYDALQQCYQQFFPDVKLMAKQKLDELLA